MKSISATELSAWLAELPNSNRPSPYLLDVREPWEFQTCQIPGSTLLPMGELAGRIEEIDPDRPVVCICHHGARSAQVAHFLDSRGFKETFNLAGGLEAWARQVDESFPRY